MPKKTPETGQTMLKRYSDTIDPASKGDIARLAFLLTCVLIILASASLAYIGIVASREADRQASSSQQQLLRLALEDRFVLLERDQLNLARWDTSVRNISLNFDRDFVVDEFMDSLWFDFGIDLNLIVGPDNWVLAESIEDDITFDTRKLEKNSPLYQLAEKARAYYLKNRIKMDGGFGQQPEQQDNHQTEKAFAFLRLNKTVFLVNAMAIIPDDGEYVLPDGLPVILISAIQINEDFVADLNTQLSFTKLQFLEENSLSKGQTIHTIVSPDGERLGSFKWQSNMVGRQIWNTVIPVITVLGIVLALVAFSIAWKIGMLTHSLATSEQHNYFLAMHDPLSGLPNRLQFNRTLAAAIEGIPDIPFTLIQCDLDHFKKVNDTLGHAAGDTVIKVVAERLNKTVGLAEDRLIGRVGGDEFVILLQNCNDMKRVKELTDNIITEICQPIEIENSQFAEIGISMGVACSPADGNSIETIMAAADQALYVAKDFGRNCAVFADDTNR